MRRRINVAWTFALSAREVRKSSYAPIERSPYAGRISFAPCDAWFALASRPRSRRREVN